ncbi:MAG: pectate lyase [Candidatus Binatia bacterium]|nr:pectate lyase [Candidatus Binatia bacterium]
MRVRTFLPRASPRTWFLAIAVAMTLCGAAPAARAELPPAVRTAIEAMLECERPEGGWMYVCAPERGSRGVTKIVNLGVRVRSTLGLEPFDLIVMRSPGTPAAGLLLLEAWERSGEERFLDDAKRTGDLILDLQLPGGGWFSEMPVHGRELAFWFKWYVPWSTLDDDVTTGAVRLLLRLFQATGDERYRVSAERGLDLLVEAQLPSGAWPLTGRPVWLRTVSPSFEDLPSLNDAATASVIRTLILGAEILDQPDLLAAAVRGGDWLVDTRHAAPAAGWAQQYDETGRAVPGRAFEPVALASWETRHALDALVALSRAVDDQRYCSAIDESVSWLADSALGPGCWARFVSPETGKPIFIDLDGNEVPHLYQAKRPYRWTGDYGIPALFAELEVPADEAEVTPRIAGDAGDCPDAPRRARRRLEARNPRARIGEAGSQMGLARGVPPSPCPRP